MGETLVFYIGTVAFNIICTFAIHIWCRVYKAPDGWAALMIGLMLSMTGPVLIFARLTMLNAGFYREARTWGHNL